MNYFSNKTIVLPYDFSELAMEAVDEALKMAEETTSIHVIHVVDPIPAIISIDPAMPVPPSYDHGRFEQALKQMQETFGQGKYELLKLHCVIGDPGTEIVEFADSIRANMIVMPSHGRKGIGRLLLGSVSERVMRLSNCPVMILRKPGD